MIRPSKGGNEGGEVPVERLSSPSVRARRPGYRCSRSALVIGSAIRSGEVVGEGLTKQIPNRHGLDPMIIHRNKLIRFSTISSSLQPMKKG